ncbi:hypothetical protein [Bacillus cereus]|uniref:hypothetical protein n=1 Tax=Bacillus cereus TaxID=1396 RepID=UPI0015CF1ADC|nr:hypothetical protein [Bacillus cereus]
MQVVISYYIYYLRLLIYRFEDSIHGILMSNQLTVVHQQDVLGQPFKVSSADHAGWLCLVSRTRLINLIHVAVSI